MKKWILVLDSGIGGLYTFGKLQKKMPKENLLYFMDKMHSPYGNKSKKRLNKIVCKNVKKIRKIFDIKMIVLACNTASVVCFESLQKQNGDLPIITIEPYSNFKKLNKSSTLVLVTKNTAKFYPKLKLIKNYKNIYLQSFDILAKMIDKASGNFDLLLPYLTDKLNKYKNLGIQNIVLGCTHYNYIKPQLKKIFGKVRFYENSELVVKKCKKVLAPRNIQSKSQKGEAIIFCKI